MVLFHHTIDVVLAEDRAGGCDDVGCATYCSTLEHSITR